MSRRLLFAVWGLIGLSSTSGCSFLFVHGPPPDHQRLPYFDCSSSNVLPVLDALYAGVATVAAVSQGVTGTTNGSTTSSSRTDTFMLAGEAALIGASAVYGFKKTSDCRSAQADMLKRAALRPTFGPGAAPVLAAPGAPPVDPWTGRPVGGLGPPAPVPATPAPSGPAPPPAPPAAAP